MVESFGEIVKVRKSNNTLQFWYQVKSRPLVVNGNKVKSVSAKNVDKLAFELFGINMLTIKKDDDGKIKVYNVNSIKCVNYKGNNVLRFEVQKLKAVGVTASAAVTFDNLNKGNDVIIIMTSNVNQNMDIY